MDNDNPTDLPTGPTDLVTVADSLADLRKLAKAVGSRDEWLEKGKRATPDEIALAETLRKPNDCSAHSNRTGLVIISDTRIASIVYSVANITPVRWPSTGPDE